MSSTFAILCWTVLGLGVVWILKVCGCGLHALPTAAWVFLVSANSSNAWMIGKSLNWGWVNSVCSCPSSTFLGLFFRNISFCILYWIVNWKSTYRGGKTTNSWWCFKRLFTLFWMYLHIIYHFHFFWLAKLVFLLGREAIFSRDWIICLSLCKSKLDPTGHTYSIPCILMLNVT